MKADAKWVPIVFTMASAVGVVGTAVLTAKCTTKAEKILSQSRTKYGGATKETVIDICRCYAPAIACGTATVVCIVSNGVLLQTAKSPHRGLYARQRKPRTVSVKG